MNKKNLDVSQFPRGSEWRRWDLHIHTPESKLGASFIGVDWPQYVDALDAAAVAHDIAVIGVTDYMSIDGYERLLGVLSSTENTKLKSIRLVLPNIEFRAMPATKNGNALNIHLLVDPSDPNHVQRIKRALKNLKVTHGKENYGCISH